MQRQDGSGVGSVMRCRVRIFLQLIALTAVAIGWWVYAFVSINVSGIHSTWVSDADLVRERCPIHLVSPDWIPNGDLFEWMQAEMRARFSAVAIVWAIGVYCVIRMDLRRRRGRG